MSSSPLPLAASYPHPFRRRLAAHVLHPEPRHEPEVMARIEALSAAAGSPRWREDVRMFALSFVAGFVAFATFIW